MTSREHDATDGQRLEPVVENPSQVADENDPGDAVQRSFRYQHAYGAILLIAGAANQRPYTAIWCEHHEDLLVERTDGHYEAYQVKTRRPGRGDWTLNDTDLKRSS